MKKAIEFFKPKKVTKPITNQLINLEGTHYFDVVIMLDAPIKTLLNMNDINWFLKIMDYRKNFTRTFQDNTNNIKIEANIKLDSASEIWSSNAYLIFFDPLQATYLPDLINNFKYCLETRCRYGKDSSFIICFIATNPLPDKQEYEQGIQDILDEMDDEKRNRFKLIDHQISLNLLHSTANLDSFFTKLATMNLELQYNDTHYEENSLITLAHEIPDSLHPLATACYVYMTLIKASTTNADFLPLDIIVHITSFLITNFYQTCDKEPFSLQLSNAMNQEKPEKENCRIM